MTTLLRQQAIQQLQAGETQAQNVVALHMFKYLSMELDTEGRYLFLNAIANQLRYPNNHTHYFSFIMLYLFFESDQVRGCFCLSLSVSLFCEGNLFFFL